MLPATASFAREVQDCTFFGALDVYGGLGIVTVLARHGLADELEHNLLQGVASGLASA